VSEQWTGPEAGDRVEVTNRSVGELFGEVASDVSQLVRQEVALAKAEIREEAKNAGKGAGMYAGAGLGGYLAILFASLAAMFGLAVVLPIGWAALIIAVLWGIVAFVLMKSGQREFRRVNPVPEQTVQSVKEDVQWAKAQVK
jgi:hypothetical protein